MLQGRRVDAEGSSLTTDGNVFVQTSWFVFCICGGEGDLQQHADSKHGAKHANVSHQKSLPIDAPESYTLDL